jgi:hypothetical protein
MVIRRKLREVELLQLELVRKTNSTVNLRVHQDGGLSSNENPEMLAIEVSIAEI